MTILQGNSRTIAQKIGEKWTGGGVSQPTIPKSDRLLGYAAGLNIPDQPASGHPGPLMTAIQPNNPLHGITLERLLKELVTIYGWPGLGQRIDIRCFTHEPSLSSSLKFLRRTPWARERVEALYLDMLKRRSGSA